MMSSLGVVVPRKTLGALMSSFGQEGGTLWCEY